jgi:hypothetical protein
MAATDETELLLKKQEVEAQLHALENDIVRAKAEAAWRLLKLKEQEDMDTQATHHEACRHVTHWLGRKGELPKHTKHLLPLPAHAQRGKTGGNTCPGCSIEAWANCLNSVKKPSPV